MKPTNLTRRGALKLLLGASAFAFATQGGTARAITQDDIDKTEEQLAAAQEKYDEVEAQLDEIATQYEGLSQELADTLAQIDDVNAQIATTERQIEDKELTALFKRPKKGDRVS